MQQALSQLDWLFRSSDASGMQSSDNDKGAAGIDCSVKTAIKNLLVTFEECEEDAEIES